MKGGQGALRQGGFLLAFHLRRERPQGKKSGVAVGQAEKLRITFNGNACAHRRKDVEGVGY